MILICANYCSNLRGSETQLMRVLGLMLIISLLAYSCKDDYETIHLKQRITDLENRVDSLQMAIQLISQPPIKQSVRKKQPRPKSATTKKQTDLTEINPVVKEPVEKTTYTTSAPVSQSYSPSNTRRVSSSTSSQCMGITKKGARCKRMVKGGGYCWQH